MQRQCMHVAKVQHFSIDFLLMAASWACLQPHVKPRDWVMIAYVLYLEILDA